MLPQSTVSPVVTRAYIFHSLSHGQWPCLGKALSWYCQNLLRQRLLMYAIWHSKLYNNDQTICTNILDRKSTKLRTNDKHVEAGTKWPIFCRYHFHFLGIIINFFGNFLNSLIEISLVFVLEGLIDSRPTIWKAFSYHEVIIRWHMTGWVACIEV